jgi:hypothetical protein
MAYHRYGILLLVSVCMLFPSCAAKMKQKLVDEPYQSKTLSVPLAVSAIEVVDGRAPADTNRVRPPRFSIKIKGDTVIPPLTPEQKKVISDEIRRYVVGEGVGVRVKATVSDGVKQYNKGFFYAREYTRAVVTVELLDGVTQPWFYKTTGEADYEVKSISPDSTFLETLYRKALKTSLYKAFESVNEFLEKR